MRHAAKELLVCAGANESDLRVPTPGADGGESDSLASCAKLFSGQTQEIEDWRTRVHAMNILRLLFKDSQVGMWQHVVCKLVLSIFSSVLLSLQMAEALDALIPVVIRVAVGGFTSSAWHVRNSSVMLYSAG